MYIYQGNIQKYGYIYNVIKKMNNTILLQNDKNEFFFLVSLLNKPFFLNIANLYKEFNNKNIHLCTLLEKHINILLKNYMYVTIYFHNFNINTSRNKNIDMFNESYRNTDSTNLQYIVLSIHSSKLFLNFQNSYSCFFFIVYKYINKNHEDVVEYCNHLSLNKEDINEIKYLLNILNYCDNSLYLDIDSCACRLKIFINLSKQIKVTFQKKKYGHEKKSSIWDVNNYYNIFNYVKSLWNIDKKEGDSDENEDSSNNELSSYHQKNRDKKDKSSKRKKKNVKKKGSRKEEKKKSTDTNAGANSSDNRSGISDYYSSSTESSSYDEENYLSSEKGKKKKEIIAQEKVNEDDELSNRKKDKKKSSKTGGKKHKGTTDSNIKEQRKEDGGKGRGDGTGGTGGGRSAGTRGKGSTRTRGKGTTGERGGTGAGGGGEEGAGTEGRGTNIGDGKCAEIYIYWDIYKDILFYINNIIYVKAKCKLTIDEEMFLYKNCNINVHKHKAIYNRFLILNSVLETKNIGEQCNNNCNLLFFYNILRDKEIQNRKKIQEYQIQYKTKNFYDKWDLFAQKDVLGNPLIEEPQLQDQRMKDWKKERNSLNNKNTNEKNAQGNFLNFDYLKNSFVSIKNVLSNTKDTNTLGENVSVSVSLIVPKIETIKYINNIDENIFMNINLYDSIGTIINQISYKKLEDKSNVDALIYLNSLLDGLDIHNFFVIYNFFINNLNIKIINGENTFLYADLLARYLYFFNYSISQYSKIIYIFIFIINHQEIISMLPKIDDQKMKKNYLNFFKSNDAVFTFFNDIFKFVQKFQKEKKYIYKKILYHIL